MSAAPWRDASAARALQLRRGQPMAARTWAESYLSLLSAAVLGATATVLAYFRNDIIACVQAGRLSCGPGSPPAPRRGGNRLDAVGLWQVQVEAVLLYGGYGLGVLFAASLMLDAVRLSGVGAAKPGTVRACSFPVTAALPWLGSPWRALPSLFFRSGCR